MTVVRRVERAAEEADHAKLDELVADRDLVAFLRALRASQRLGQLLVAGRAAHHPEARVGAEDAIAAPRGPGR